MSLLCSASYSMLTSSSSALALFQSVFFVSSKTLFQASVILTILWQNFVQLPECAYIQYTVGELKKALWIKPAFSVTHSFNNFLVISWISVVSWQKWHYFSITLQFTGQCIDETITLILVVICLMLNEFMFSMKYVWN